MGTTILGKTVIGPNVAFDGLIFYDDPSNPASYPGTGGAVEFIDITRTGIVDPNILNITDPVPWSANCFTTYDEKSSNSIHFVNSDVCNLGYGYLGFTLNNKGVINYSIWRATFTIEVITGITYSFMGSAGGGYTEGPQYALTTGTYDVDRIYHVSNNYYTIHEGSALQFCFRSVYPTEARITNLDVRQLGYGGVLMYGASVIDNKISLDGGNDFLGTSFRTDDHFSDNDEFSVSIWVKPTVDIDGNGGLLCNQKYSSEDTPGGFGVVIYDTNQVGVNLTKDTVSGTTSYENICPITLIKDVWQEITYTYSPATNTIYGYKNGDLVDTSTNSSYEWTPENTNSIIGTNTQGGWINYFAMKIGIIKIYNRMLSSLEVKQNYFAFVGKYGL